MTSEWVYDLKGKEVVFTENFDGYVKAVLAKIARDLGARNVSGWVNQSSTDLLVRGFSKAWKYGDYGDREKQVADMQSYGHRIQLIDEKGFHGLRSGFPAPALKPHSPNTLVRAAAEGGVVGAPYRPGAFAGPLQGDGEHYRDPDIMERGLKAHSATQDKLAELIGLHGLTPLSTEGGWEMAAPLLYRLEDLPSGTSGGAKFNILSGVLLAVIDDDADRLNGVGQCIPSSRNDLHTSVLGSLAFLLHRNNFNSYGNWSQSGATDVLSAGAAWLIQTIGIVSRDDEHLEKRCIENLIPMLKSLGPSGVLWGIDRTAIEAGFANLHDRCPELWRQHGRELERETGVELRAVPKSSSDFEHRVSGPRG